MNDQELAIFEDVSSEAPEEFTCEVCGYYPLTPVHGHFECSNCRYKTKCCEGM